MMSKPLTIYKASAGSGKTFTLALEYIRLLIANPNAYRSILAVTFTNKATEEMKTRILLQLYGIAFDLDDKDTQDYIRILLKDGYSKATIAQHARLALSNLLHNYSYFRVETIDSFFQSVLRNLAQELELPANLRLELNDKQVEQMAVDEMVEQLERTSDELKWILSYIRETIDDDKGWNVIGKIKHFGENIFKDDYRKERQKLNEVLHKKGFFSDYKSQLTTIRRKALEDMKYYADEFFKQLDSHGLTVEDLANKERGIASYFKKIKDGTFDESIVNATVRKAIEDPMNWLKKADRREDSPAYNVVREELHPLLLKCESARPKCFWLYKSADLTLRNINQLRLLNSIDTYVREMNKATNRFLLSDTQPLLNALICDSDSPFVFEKIGARLRHIMIDEFQDTSTVQWKNFKVLLKECLSHTESSNLIVGDVKQSIYRWRAGDWKLLNNIESEFTQQQTETIPLDVNFRSSPRIIEFNNIFFTKAARAEADSIAAPPPYGADQIMQAYREIVQEWPESHAADGGYVGLELLPNDDYQARTNERVRDTIAQLLSAGHQPKDIAIIMRSNQNIQEMAEYLLQEMPDVKLVSDEAFRLDASTAVNTIVEAMRALANPDDLLTIAHLAAVHQNTILGRKLPYSELFADISTTNGYLPTEYTDASVLLRSMPVYDLAERLYSIFGLSALPDDTAYVCAFYDQLRKFLADEAADIDHFLEAWDESIHSKTIQTDNLDGIRLLTIHKSKGLEFDNVIIPFCDWKLELANLIWCKPETDVQPFSALPTVPIDFSASQMKGTVYDNDYQHEHLQNIVDNLNLLYVAFTRAAQNLFVFGKKSGKGIRSELIGNIIQDVASGLTGAVLDPENEAGSTTFTYGQLARNSKTRKSSKNVFRQKWETQGLEINHRQSTPEFMQSNQSRRFASADSPDEKQQDYIAIGTVMHEVFSTIRTLADIPDALYRLEQEGILQGTPATRQRLAAMLQERLSDARVAYWFSDRWTLFNECSILFVDPADNKVGYRRPDRVMTDGRETIVVDFKFARPDASHNHQVRQYMQLLGDMGFNNVKGYLWYVYSNKIQEV